MDSQIDRWLREADRYSVMAEQSATRVYAILSVGLLAMAGSVAAAISARSALLMAFTPLVGLFTLAVISASVFESLYVATYQRYADIQVRRLTDETVEGPPPYGRGPWVPRRLVRFNNVVWAFDIGLLVLISIALDVGAWILNFGGWVFEANWMGSTGIALCDAALLVAATFLALTAKAAWRELLDFQSKYVGSEDP
jgi:hypothetical protein